MRLNFPKDCYRMIIRALFLTTNRFSSSTKKGHVGISGGAAVGSCIIKNIPNVYNLLVMVLKKYQLEIIKRQVCAVRKLKCRYISLFQHAPCPCLVVPKVQTGNSSIISANEKISKNTEKHNTLCGCETLYFTTNGWLIFIFIFFSSTRYYHWYWIVQSQLEQPHRLSPAR